MASIFLWVDEGDHDVSRSLCSGQPFVEMCQTTGMHEDPTTFGVSDGTIVSVK